MASGSRHARWLAACTLFACTSGYGEQQRPTADGGGVDGAVPDSSMNDDGSASPDGSADGASLDGGVIDGSPPIARYVFDEASGTVVHDKVAPALDLEIVRLAGDAGTGFTWSADGLTIDGDETMVRSPGPATKITSAVVASGELTVEAWVEAATSVQGGPARIVSLAADVNLQTFMVGQEGTSWVFRTVQSGGTFQISGGSVLTGVTHVVGTRDKAGLRTLYVGGLFAASQSGVAMFESAGGGTPLSLANEIVGGRQWHGKLVAVAIFDRALSSSEVAARAQAGPAK